MSESWIETEGDVTRRLYSFIGRRQSASLMEYCSPRVVWELPSSADPEECERLIGKTVDSIQAYEHVFVIFFTDGSSVRLEGHTYDGCALSVQIEEETND